MTKVCHRMATVAVVLCALALRVNAINNNDISSSSTSTSEPEVLDASLQKLGIHGPYPSTETLIAANTKVQHHVFYGQEDSIIELSLPQNCAHFGWFGGSSSPSSSPVLMHGAVTATDGMTLISSATRIPSSSHCTLLFSPEADFSGEQQVWFTVRKSGSSSTAAAAEEETVDMHIATIVVSPTRDPPGAINDVVSVRGSTTTTTQQQQTGGGSWVYIPVLANDGVGDADVTASPVCLQYPPPSSTVASSGDSGSNTQLTVRIVLPSADGGHHHPTPASPTERGAGDEPNSKNMQNGDAQQPIALIAVGSTTDELGTPTPCYAAPGATSSSSPVDPIMYCTVTIPVNLPHVTSSSSSSSVTIQAVAVTILPRLVAGSSITPEPYSYNLHNVPASTTVVIRHEAAGKFLVGYPKIFSVQYANASLPVCKELRILSVSDPLHGHAVAVPIPLIYESNTNYNNVKEDKASTHTVGAAGADVPSHIISRSVKGIVSYTQAYSTVPGASLNVLIAYHPDPGFVGVDTFSYDIGDGIAGNGQKVTGTVTVNVIAPVENNTSTNGVSDTHGGGGGDDDAHLLTCPVWKCSIQTFDGAYNSFLRPEKGSMMTPLRRLATPAYADGIDTPAGGNRPSTRVISNELFHQAENIYNQVGLSELSVHMGQFLTHDIDFSTPLADYKAEANFVIPIPEGDPWFDQATMRFRRSGPQLGTGAGTNVPRQQLNKITSWLDLNVIYGTLTGRNRALRSPGGGGKLLHMVGTEQVHNNTQGVASPLAAAKNQPKTLKDEHCFSLSEDNEQDTEILAFTSVEKGVVNASTKKRTFCKPIRGHVEHLSLNVNHLPNLNLLGRARDSLFVSGDNRANVQPGLAAMHTLLAREHNTVADEVQASLLMWRIKNDAANIATTGGSSSNQKPNVVPSNNNDATDPLWRTLNPHAPSYHTPPLPTFHQPVLLAIPSITTLSGNTSSAASAAGIPPYPVPLAWPYPFDGSPAALKAYDEAIYQTARAITRAKWQAMVWYEWLPLMLGPAAYSRIPAYSGYKPDVDSSAANEFATAAFRFGHSQISSIMKRIDSSTGCPIEAGAISLRDAYFTATRILAEGGIDPVISGSIIALAQDVDTRAVNEIRNLLFATHTQGFDLIAFNIQRGRDHGLPDYNTIRAAVGLAKVKTFQDISTNPEVSAVLQELYTSVDDIDLVVGGLAEDHLPGAAVGPLFSTMIRDQFTRIRDADRFWFENPYSPQASLLEKVATIEEFKLTRVADFLARSTDALDGRFGAEVVWAQPQESSITPNTGYFAPKFKRAYREKISSSLADSLYLARPSVLPALNDVCEGAYEQAVFEQLERDMMHQDPATASSSSSSSGGGGGISPDVASAMAEMGIEAGNGDASYV